MSKPAIATSSFVTEVLANAGQIEKDDLNEKLTRLSKRVEEVKVEVYDTLQKKYDEFYPDLKTAMQLHDRVQTLSHDMDTMAVKIEKEIKTKLQASTSEFKDLSEQLKEANTRHAILGKLVCIHDNLESIDKDLQLNNYVGAAKRLDIIGTRLKEPANQHENEVRILSVLHTQYTLQTEKLKQDISTAWGKYIRWVLPEEEAPKHKTVVLRIDTTEQCKETILNITQALYNINLLDPKLNIFSDRLIDYILKAAVDNKHFVLDMKDNKENIELISKYSAEHSNEPVTPQDVYQRLTLIFNFLNENLFSFEIDTGGGSKKPLMSLLGNGLRSPIQEYIISKCLAQSIPSSQKELGTFKAVISETASFHDRLVGMQFLDAEDKTLLDFVNNINVHFANKKCQEILERARGLMTSELHNMVQVSGNYPFGELPPLDIGGAKKGKASEPLALPANMKLSANIFKMPSFCVSQHAPALMELAYETLVEATSSRPQCALQLFYTTRNVFELYCSVVPAYHKESLQTLPQLAALQHNNYMYLAHHLLTLGHQYKAQLPPPLSQGAATFIDLVPWLRRLGTECFLGQLAKQRDQLLHTLKQAAGFACVAESEARQAAERSVKQTVHQLEHLANIWRPVLPQNIYAKAIGTLLNSVLVEVITSVTSLEDISADDATQLHSVMSILATRGPHLFHAGAESEADNNPVAVHKFVRKWVKFEEILLLLNANLQGISDRWADGKGPLAHECSATEVKQLIRALFQNTDRRAAVLAKIK